jgi:hypothetical protein
MRPALLESGTIKTVRMLERFSLLAVTA